MPDNRNVSIRLSVENADAVLTALKAVGASGQAAFDNFSKAATDAYAKLQAGGQTLKSANDAHGSLTGKVVEAAGGMLGFTGAMTVANVAAQAFTKGLDLIKEHLEEPFILAAKSEQQFLRLNAVLSATGNASGLTAKMIGNLAEEIEHGTLQSSSAALNAATILASFGAVSGEAFGRTMHAAADLATVFNGDLQSATTVLGKALADPIAGLTALRRAGISFTESQREQIEVWARTGESAKATAAILERVEQAVGGAAGAERGGLIGQTKGLTDAWETFLRRIGETASSSDGAMAALRRLATGAIEALTPLTEAQARAQRIAELQADTASTRTVTRRDNRGNIISRTEVANDPGGGRVRRNNRGEVVGTTGGPQAELAALLADAAYDENVQGVQEWAAGVGAEGAAARSKQDQIDQRSRALARQKEQADFEASLGGMSKPEAERLRASRSGEQAFAAKFFPNVSLEDLRQDPAIAAQLDQAAGLGAQGVSSRQATLLADVTRRTGTGATIEGRRAGAAGDVEAQASLNAVLKTYEETLKDVGQAEADAVLKGAPLAPATQALMDAAQREELAKLATRTADWSVAQDRATAATLRLVAAQADGAAAVFEATTQNQIEQEVAKLGETQRDTVTQKIREQQAAQVDLVEQGIKREATEQLALAEAMAQSRQEGQLYTLTQANLIRGFDEVTARADAKLKLDADATPIAATTLRDLIAQTESQARLNDALLKGGDAYRAQQVQEKALGLARQMYGVESLDRLTDEQRKNIDLVRDQIQAQQDLQREIQKDPWKGAQAAARQYFDSLQNYGQIAGDFLTNSVFRPLERTLSNFFMTGKLDFASLVTSVKQGLADMAAKYVMSFVGGVAGSLGAQAGNAFSAWWTSGGAKSAGTVSDLGTTFADGGRVSGPGGPRDDVIMAWLSDEEHVINAYDARRTRPALDAINSGRYSEAVGWLLRASNDNVGGYADGGPVYRDGLPGYGFGGISKITHALANPVAAILGDKTFERLTDPLGIGYGHAINKATGYIGDAVGGIANGVAKGDPKTIAMVAVAIAAPEMLPYLMYAFAAYDASQGNYQLAAIEFASAAIPQAAGAYSASAAANAAQASQFAGEIGMAASPQAVTLSQVAATWGSDAAMAWNTAGATGLLGTGEGTASFFVKKIAADALTHGVVDVMHQVFPNQFPDPSKVNMEELQLILSGAYDFQRAIGRNADTAAMSVGRLPGMATGGVVGPGDFIAGEYGPERIRVGAPARVYSRDATQALAGNAELGAKIDGLRADIRNLTFMLAKALDDNGTLVRNTGASVAHLADIAKTTARRAS